MNSDFSFQNVPSNKEVCVCSRKNRPHLVSIATWHRHFSLASSYERQEMERARALRGSSLSFSQIQPPQLPAPLQTFSHNPTAGTSSQPDTIPETSIDPSLQVGGVHYVPPYRPLLLSPPAGSSSSGSRADIVSHPSVNPSFGGGNFHILPPYHLHPSNQLIILQEQCRGMEIELTKVTAERDALRACLMELAGKLTIASGQNIDLSIIQLPPPTPQSQPTPETHPAIRFWNKRDYLMWRETAGATASGKTRPRGKLPYLEDSDGKALEDVMVKSIRKLLRVGWNDLLLRNLAPRKWGQASQSALTYIKNLMERAYPVFTFAVHGWKLDHLIITHYPSWARRRFGKGNAQVKKEDDESEDEECDEAENSLNNFAGATLGLKRKNTKNTQPSKKRKIVTVSVEGWNCSQEDTPKGSQDDTPESSQDTVAKSSQDDTREFDDPDDLESLYISQEPTQPRVQLLDPPANLLSGSQEFGDNLDVEPPSQDSSQSQRDVTADADHTLICSPSEKPDIDPLSMDSLKSAGIIIPPLPPMPAKDCEKANTTVKPKAGKAKGMKASPDAKTKLRLGKSPSGRTLCSYRWAKQVRHGNAFEFNQYYEESLTQEQRLAYNREAEELVHTGKWDVKTFGAGTLY